MTGRLVEAWTSSRSHALWIVAVIAMMGGSTAVAARLSRKTEVSISYFLRDPNAIAHQPWFYGMIEFAGILILAGTAAVLLFSAVIARPEDKQPLAAWGLLTGIICLDDTYMLHERGFFFGLPELLVFGFYLIAIVGLLSLSWNWLVHTPLLILFFSLGCLGLSAVLDVFEDFPIRIPGGSEDFLEFFAFSFWGAYFTATARLAILIPDRESRPARQAVLAKQAFKHARHGGRAVPERRDAEGIL